MKTLIIPNKTGQNFIVFDFSSKNIYTVDNQSFKSFVPENYYCCEKLNISIRIDKFEIIPPAQNDNKDNIVEVYFYEIYKNKISDFQELINYLTKYDFNFKFNKSYLILKQRIDLVTSIETATTFYIDLNIVVDKNMNFAVYAEYNITEIRENIKSLKKLCCNLVNFFDYIIAFLEHPNLLYKSIKNEKEFVTINKIISSSVLFKELFNLFNYYNNFDIKPNIFSLLTDFQVYKDLYNILYYIELMAKYKVKFINRFGKGYWYLIINFNNAMLTAIKVNVFDRKVENVLDLFIRAAKIYKKKLFYFVKKIK